MLFYLGISINDVSSNFFTIIFTGVIDALTNFNDNEFLTLVINNNTYTIQSSSFNFLSSSANLLLLRNLISLSWVFFIGLLLYKDIRRRIWKIREFRWGSAFNDDISADRL